MSIYFFFFIAPDANFIPTRWENSRSHSATGALGEIQRDDILDHMCCIYRTSGADRKDVPFFCLRQILLALSTGIKIIFRTISGITHLLHSHLGNEYEG